VNHLKQRKQSSFCGLKSYHLSTEAVNVFLSAKSPDEISGGFVKTLTRRDIAKLQTPKVDSIQEKKITLFDQ